MEPAAASRAARRLGGALEPVIGQVYFSPEAHAAYERLGFDAGAGEINGVALPDGPAYFTSRGSVMGQVSGEVVAAAFGVFDPAVVVPCVTLGWSRTDAPTICAARDEGALAQLDRLLGPAPDGLDLVVAALARAVEPLRPEGRPLFAGLSSLPIPDHPLGAVWRHGDRLREFRGDCHTAAWTSAGLDATEIGLLTELYWGLPLRSYSRTRGWSDAAFDAAVDRLEARGLVADGAFTDDGRILREQIERATDAGLTRAIEAIGDDFDDVVRGARGVGYDDPLGSRLSRRRTPRPRRPGHLALRAATSPPAGADGRAARRTDVGSGARAPPRRSRTIRG